MIITCDASLVLFGAKPRYSRAKIGLGYSDGTPYILMITAQRREKLEFTAGCKLFKSAISFQEPQRDLYIKNADKVPLDVMMAKLRAIKNGGVKPDLPPLDSLEFQKVQTKKINVLGHEYNVKELKNKDLTVATFDKTTNLPKSLWKLTNLTVLRLTNCELVEIPDQVSNLINLVTVDVSNNKLRMLKTSLLARLQNLAQLNASHNELEFIPLELGFLKKLVALNLNNNQIEQIPFTIIYLKELKELFLSHNKMNAVAYDVARLMRDKLRLTKLDLFGNFPASNSDIVPLPPKPCFPSLFSICSLAIITSRDTLKAAQIMLPNRLYQRIQTGSEICYQCKKLHFEYSYIIEGLTNFDLASVATEVATGCSKVPLKFTFCLRCVRKAKRVLSFTPFGSKDDLRLEQLTKSLWK